MSLSNPPSAQVPLDGQQRRFQNVDPNKINLFQTNASLQPSGNYTQTAQTFQRISGAPQGSAYISGNYNGPTNVQYLSTSTNPAQQMNLQNRTVSYLPGSTFQSNTLQRSPSYVLPGAAVSTTNATPYLSPATVGYVGAGSQINRGTNQTIINDGIFKSGLQQKIYTSGVRETQVFTASGPPLPALQTSTWRPTQSTVRPVVTSQITSTLPVPVAAQATVTNLPPIVETVYREKKDTQFESRKTLYQSQGYKQQKKASDFCLPLLGILALIGLLVGLFFAVRAISQANSGQAESRADINYRQTGKDTNNQVINNSTTGNTTVVVPPSTNTNNSVYIDTTTITSGNTTGSTTGNTTTNNSTIFGNTTVRVPSSAVLLASYKNDSNWLKVDKAVKNTDNRINSTLEPSSVYVAVSNGITYYYPTYVINGVNNTYSVPVSSNGEVIAATPISTSTTTTTTTTTPSTATITRLTQVPQTATTIQTAGNSDWQKVDNYIRQSDAIIGSNATLQSVSISKSGTVTSYFPTYLVNGKPSILAVGLTDTGSFTSPVISNSASGKTLPTISSVPTTAESSTNYQTNPLWMQVDSYIRNNDNRISSAAVVKSVKSIKQGDVNTFYNTYEVNGQQLTYGVAIRDNGQIIPIGTSTSTVVPSTATNLTTASSDQNWIKIDQYLRSNDQRNLGSSPSFQQVKINTQNGVTTYYPTYLSTDKNFSLLYQTIIDSTGNVQVKSLAKKALVTGHHHRHNLQSVNGENKMEHRHMLRR